MNNFLIDKKVNDNLTKNLKFFNESFTVTPLDRR